jgi:hypothetical protein
MEKAIRALRGGEAMFATTIRFGLPMDVEDTDWEELRQFLVRGAFETDRRLPGLRSASVVLSPERGEFGGNYVWETQDDGEAFLRSDRYRSLAHRFGEPHMIERCDVCAYVEDGDLLFPHDDDIQTALGPSASIPPLGL